MSKGERAKRLRRSELLEQLLEVARGEFDRVEQTQGDFRSGTCRIRDEHCLILNRALGVEANLRTVATVLAHREMKERYLLPVVRNAIEQYAEA